MDDDPNFRHSMMNNDLQQDRRLIMKKIQHRKRSQRQSQRLLQSETSQGAADGNKEGEPQQQQRNNVDEYHGQSGITQTMSDDNEDSLDDDGYYRDETFDEELLRDVKEAHQQDEQLLGGRIEDGQEEGLEAMNQALTSPPTQWWAMRKQWQKRQGNVMSMMGMGGRGGGGGRDVPDELLDGLDGSLRSNHDGGIDGSHRSALSSSMRRNGQVGVGGTLMSTTTAGVVGHPVMLEDPTSIGYDVTSFRQNPNSLVEKKKRTPSVVFVSRDMLQKRKIKQMIYIIAALCVVFLFMFFLQQRKLSHYAMVESPISLSAYLAGEQLLAEEYDDEGKKKVTLDDLGLKEFHGVDWVPQVEFGSIELDPNDPLANGELANDPLVGDHINPPESVVDEFKLLGDDRFELLKSLVVGWAVSPLEVFDNRNSPQYLALHWMAHEDVLRYTPDDDRWIKKIIQRYALAVIYYSTDGLSWNKKLLFLSNYDECNWNRENIGFFEGAGHCDEEGFITALTLWSNDLKGALPPEIGALSSLKTLALFNNNLNMPPPKSLIRLESLQRLYVQKNKFKANLDYLCEMPKLKDIKADCENQGGVKCSCCKCGWDDKEAKKDMMVDLFT